MRQYVPRNKGDSIGGTQVPKVRRNWDHYCNWSWSNDQDTPCPKCGLPSEQTLDQILNDPVLLT